MNPLGGLALLGWMIAIAYHFCNGIRHLIWDTGHALDLGSAERAGIWSLWAGWCCRPSWSAARCCSG